MKHSKVSAKQIRGTDVPTEYIAVGAFLIIALAGAFVGFQVKKAGSGLPLGEKNRLD